MAFPSWLCVSEGIRGGNAVNFGEDILSFGVVVVEKQ